MAPRFNEVRFNEFRFSGEAAQPNRKAHSMYPITVTTGFMNSVASFLAKYKADLIAKKLDPTDDIAQLPLDAKALTDANQDQESLKTQLKEKTTQVEDLNSQGYANASTLLDAAIGKLGKTTPAGKEGARLRSQLRGRDTGGATPPPAK